MFVSIKWKAVVFLSLVMVAIFAAWISAYILRALDDFALKNDDLYAQQQLILNQLLDDNFLRLSQLSQLVAETPGIRAINPAATSSSLDAFLQREWIKLNINTGIDYIGISSLSGERLGEAINDNFFLDRKALQDAIRINLQASQNGAPNYFFYCDLGCSQFVVEPFVTGADSQGLIILGQNMADVIQRFRQVSAADIAILIEEREQGENTLDKERRLGEWKSRVWAASQFSDTLAQLKKLQHEISLEDIDQGQLYEVGEQKLLFHKLDLPPQLNRFGTTPDIYAFTDESAREHSVKQAIQSSLTSGLFALFAAVLILLLLMLGPVKRLISIVEALKRLPSQQYAEAKQLIRDRQGVFPDELATLEKSARFVTNELEALYAEVEGKNRSLEDQIAIVSRSRAFLERLIDSSHLLFATVDHDGRILTTNAQFEKQFIGLSDSFFDIFSSSIDQIEFSHNLEKLVRGETKITQFDGEFVGETGKAFFLDWTCSAVEDEAGNDVILAIGVDLTERRRDQEALEWLANHDPLTGIGNRRAFQQDLANLLHSDNEAAIIFIDVNRFKQINDLYGHNTGDLVLVQISNSLKAGVRASDSICRLAGDEFTVVMPSIDPDHLETLMAKLADSLSDSVEIPARNHSIEYSVSLGAAMYPAHGKTEQELISHSDMAMYQAKKNAASHWQIFDPNNNELAMLRKDHDLTAMIKQALSTDDRFVLRFQPILNMSDNAVSHYEVLLRMKDDKGHLVSPGDFIPAAERMGLIHQVDEWVLEHAIKKLVASNLSGCKVSFAVNVSAPTLQSVTFPETLARLIEQYQCDPGCLVVELTETAYIENFQMVLSSLNQIHRMGILVALDDFGVGFSSFSYLKKLPLSYVKLDGSYIRDLDKNLDNQVFVESLTNMVNAFGMRTIAEFVEDEATLNKLADLKVDFAQGYFIGRPEEEPNFIPLTGSMAERAAVRTRL
ncbi:MAG: hypothetical protein C9356_01530 [Oleiphilus sp.]|nr:MAG: hypothetical protein C9356_01530 [Oleiphilus sp.]